MKSIIITSLFMFICSCDFPYEHGGLNWSRPSIEEMNWHDAQEYCKDLGGRLPTINELRTLIENCPRTETDGKCQVKDDCLNDGCFDGYCDGCEYNYHDTGIYNSIGTASRVWSSLQNEDNPDNVWMVDFGYAAVLDVNKNEKIECYCVKK
ncbi:MAG TPA: DUF1566 domain-containing protein [bacterium]|nr:DUF1566 domain-containing protein [bacterium]